MRSLLITLIAFPVAAQSVASPAQRAWISGGLGPSSEGTAATASASYSRGPVVVIGRLAAAGAFFGDQINEKALLIGRRTARSSRFSIAAIGVGQARYSHTSSDAGVVRRDPVSTGLAFELKAHRGIEISELGVSFFGLIAPGRGSYVGSALSINFGWFGIDDS